MKRRPLSILVALVMALGVVASPVAAKSPHFPAQIDLPQGWMPEGITAGRGNTIYVGSLAGGGVWKGDVRTGDGDPFIPAWGGAATGVEYEARADRLWVAGGPTGTVRVYDASSGDLLRQYTFSPAGFPQRSRRDPRRRLRDRFGQQLARCHPAGPARGAAGGHDTKTLPLSGFAFVPGEFNANGIVAHGRSLIVVNTFTGGLFRVNQTTGDATQITTGGASLVNGDGLELRGRTLYVVRNFDQRVEVLRLDRG